MTKDDIMRMAREAGFAAVLEEHASEYGNGTFENTPYPELERFADLVAAHAMAQPCCGNFATCQQVCMPRAAAAQREADAKLIEEYPYWLGTVAKKEIAAAIRGTT